MIRWIHLISHPAKLKLSHRNLNPTGKQISHYGNRNIISLFMPNRLFAGRWLSADVDEKKNAKQFVGLLLGAKVLLPFQISWQTFFGSSYEKTSLKCRQTLEATSLSHSDRIHFHFLKILLEKWSVSFTDTPKLRLKRDTSLDSESMLY